MVWPRNYQVYDVRLAKHLVEPCFENWSWLFGDRDSDVIYNSNQPLAAAMHIDPAWATEKTRELFETELDQQPSRKLSPLKGIFWELEEMLER